MQLQDDLEHLEMQLAASKDSVRKIDEKLNPVKQRLRDIEEKRGDIQELQNRKCEYLELGMPPAKSEILYNPFYGLT